MTQQFAFVTQCRVATHHLGNAVVDSSKFINLQKKNPNWVEI